MNCLKRYIKPGVLLSSAAAVLIGLTAVFEGIVSRDIGPHTPLALANIVRSYLALPMMLWRMNWVKIKKREWILLIISSILFATCMYCFIDSNKRIPPVDAAAIYQLYFIMGIIIAHYWLKEYLGIYEIVLMLIVVIGVGLVCQPEFIFKPSELQKSLNSTFGYIEALGASIMAATSYNIIRRLQNIDPFCMCVIQGMVGSSLILPVAFYEFKSPQTEFEWMYAFLAAFTSGIGNILLIIALSIEDGSMVMAVQASSVIFTLVFQIPFMNIFPNWMSILGTVTVAGGLSCLILKKYIVKVCIRIRQVNTIDDCEG